MLKVKKKERNAEIPSSSMADIAFLLLVFFLLITTIDVQKGLDNSLPPDEEITKIPKENITNILVREDGNVLLANEPVEIDDIREIVEEKIAANPLMIISLKTQNRTQYSYFVRVLDQLKLANAKKISIAEPDEA